MKVTSDLGFSGRLHDRAGPWKSLYTASDGRIPALVLDAARGFSGGRLSRGITAPVSLDRPGDQLVTNQSGTTETVSANVPAIDWSTGHRRLKLAPSVTNHFSYSRLGDVTLGATGHTLGSVSIAGSVGSVIAEIVSKSALDGGYMDWRIRGNNPGGTLYLNIVDTLSITGLATGTPTTISARMGLLSGSMPAAVTANIYRHVRNASNALYNGGGTIVQLSSNLTRYSHVFDMPAGYDRVSACGLYFRVASGAPSFDFTVRVASPQFEVGTLFAGRLVETAGTAATWVGDSLAFDVGGYDFSGGISARLRLTDVVPYLSKSALVTFEAANGDTVTLLCDGQVGSFVVKGPTGLLQTLSTAALPGAEVPIEFRVEGTQARLFINDAEVGSVTLAAATTPVKVYLGSPDAGVAGADMLVKEVCLYHSS